MIKRKIKRKEKDCVGLGGEGLADAALAGKGDIQLGENGGSVGLEGLKGERLAELEAESGAGDDGAWGDDEQSEFGAFDGALEAIPERGRHAAEFRGGSVAQVEHN